MFANRLEGTCCETSTGMSDGRISVVDPVPTGLLLGLIEKENCFFLFVNRQGFDCNFT